MAKGPRITPSVRNKIASIFLKDRSLIAKEVLEELRKSLGEQAPGLSAVQKELTRIRRNPNVSSELDKTWEIGAIGKYGVPAEIVPTIIELLRNRNNKGEIGGRSFVTIRQALWIARLAPLMDSIKEDILALYSSDYEINKSQLLQYMLIQMAAAYARCEQIAELNNEVSPGEKVLFDTKELDDMFFIYKTFWHDPKTREQSLTPMSFIDREVI
jgi:hypothetical protein